MRWWSVAGGEGFYRPMIRAQSFCGQWTSQVLLRVFFFFFLLPSRGTGWFIWAGVGYFLLQVGQALVSFSWGQTLFRTEHSGIFQGGSFSPAPARSTRGFFFPSLFTVRTGRAPVTKTYKIWRNPMMAGSPWSFYLSGFYTLSPQQFAITVQVILPWHRSHGCFCSSKCDSLYLPVLLILGVWPVTLFLLWI